MDFSMQLLGERPGIQVTIALDLRKLNQETMDVYLRRFSKWCWEGWCNQLNDDGAGAECAAWVRCECSCHGRGGGWDRWTLR
jgi:hypothetical protein